MQSTPPKGNLSNPPLLPIFDEREVRLRAAYDWCLRDPRVRAAYGGQVVVAEKGKVWGAGRTHADAWRAAQDAGCTGQHEVVLVVVPALPTHAASNGVKP